MDPDLPAEEIDVVNLQPKDLTAAEPAASRHVRRSPRSAPEVVEYRWLSSPS
jgi:hypothetical protein